MKLFRLLIKNGEELFVFANDQKEVINYYKDVHIMNCVEVHYIKISKE